MNSRYSQRKALIVIDGMNYWQWTILEKALDIASVNHNSSASLAYIPTITAWSRQAIFKGSKPDLTENNSKERNLFEAFWESNNVSSYQVEFKNLSINENLDLNEISNDVVILGIVCNDLDNILHGAVMGNDQLRSNTEQWIEKSKIVKTICDLKDAGFQIYLTSDHGSIDAKGVKNLTIKDKAGALSRGKRHLHFTNEIMMQSFLEQNPNLDIGQRELSVYLKQQDAFTTEYTQVITHGGSHFWEVIVPFITINEK